MASNTVEDNDDTTARVVRALGQIESWTSPELKNRVAVYEEDADEWLQQEVSMMDTTTADDAVVVAVASPTDARVGTTNRKTPSSTGERKAKSRPKQLPRSLTPVHSNKKKDNDDDDDDRRSTNTPASKSRISFTPIGSRSGGAGPSDTPFSTVGVQTPMHRSSFGNSSSSSQKPFSSSLFGGSIIEQRPMPLRLGLINSTRRDTAYRHYHKALWNFLQQQHRQEQFPVVSTGVVNIMGATTTLNNNADPSARFDLEFLSMLSQRGQSPLWTLLYELRKLTSAGSPTTTTAATKAASNDHVLIWNERDAAKRRSELQDTIFQLSNSPQLCLSTQARVVQCLYETSPLMQRRAACLSVLQQWFQSDAVTTEAGAKLAKATPKHPRSAQEEAALVQALLFGASSSAGAGPTTLTQDDKTMFQACLWHYQCGNMKKLEDTLFTFEQGWRVAQFAGGAWYNLVYDDTSTSKSKTSTTDDVIMLDGVEEVTNKATVLEEGNPSYFLWKCMTQQYLDKTLQSSSSDKTEHSPHEAALVALCAGNLSSALSNPTLRSWRSALHACLSLSLSHTEETLVHSWLTKMRRDDQVLIPGSDLEKYETQHLKTTADLATSMADEVAMIQTLEASPYEQVRTSQTLLQRLMSGVLVGQGRLVTVLEADVRGIDRLLEGNQSEGKEDLRLLVHLLIFLNVCQQRQQQAVSDGGKPTKVQLLPPEMRSVEAWKNQVVLRYVQHLGDHPELWRLMSLYVSLLPPATVLEHLPPLLVPMEESNLRHFMVQSMEDCFDLHRRGGDDGPFGKGKLVLSVLSRVVQLILRNPNKTKEQKCLSVEWLSVIESHFGVGLQCVNQVCRQFLLEAARASKLPDDEGRNSQGEPASEATVAEFLSLYCPRVLLDIHEENEVGDQRELHAIQTYLDASAAFDKWKTIMEKVEIDEDVVKVNPQYGLDDLSRLNEAERGIARSLEQRNWAQQKRDEADTVTEAAIDAIEKLRAVLEFAGGWMSDDLDINEEEEGDDDDDMEEDDDLRIRQKSKRKKQEREDELFMLRVQYLPQSTFMMINVGEGTATWLEDILKVGLELEYGTNWKQCLKLLDFSSSLDSDDNNDGSVFSPTYWWQLTRTVAAIVSNLEGKILDSFPRDLKMSYAEKMRDVNIRSLDWK